MRDVMDACGETHPAQFIVFIKPSQCGSTEGMVSAIGAIADMWPCPMIYALPDLSALRDMAHARFHPMFNTTDALNDKINHRRTSDGQGVTTLRIPYPGGRLSMVTARSSVAGRAMTARCIFADEVDAYPASLPGGEGDPLDALITRTISFGETRKIFIGSTPKGGFDSSTVYRHYQNTDRRLFYVPCPSCKKFQNLLFKHLVWDRGQPDTAKYQCPHCKEMWDEDDKDSIMPFGEWRPTRKTKTKTRIGFWLNQLYSPRGFKSWAQMAEDYEAAENDVSKMAMFVQTSLATPFEHSEFQPSKKAVKNQIELPDGVHCPLEVSLITCGMDVHDDRVELYSFGWSTEKEIPYALDRAIFKGRMTDDVFQKELFHSISKISYTKENGAIMTPRLFAIDTGHHTKETYDFIAIANDTSAASALSVSRAWAAGSASSSTSPSGR